MVYGNLSHVVGVSGRMLSQVVSGPWVGAAQGVGNGSLGSRWTLTSDVRLGGRLLDRLQVGLIEVESGSGSSRA